MKEMRFIAIMGSHYVERARWALDVAGLPYRTEAYPPAIHFWATTLNRPAGSKSTSTPMLVTGDPAVGTLTDSADILAWAHAHPEAKAEVRVLYPSDPEVVKEVKELEQRFNKGE
jgi:glutathione S-transferase